MNTRPIIWQIVKAILVLGGLVLIGAIISIYLAATSEAGDLKCVTIKFKNDSELKLKTQWFVNAPTTRVNCRWLVMPAERDYEAAIAYWKEMGRQVRETPEYKEYGNYEMYSCDTLSLDRTLLFPPDIRKEPTSKRVYNDDGSWDCITTKGKIDEDGWQQYFMIPVRDTIPGEALLWYEETKP